LLSDAAREIVRPMEEHGVRRILWESALGVGETRSARFEALQERNRSCHDAMAGLAVEKQPSYETAAN
jgi:hypothetical protein